MGGPVPATVTCRRCGHAAWPLQEGQCQACVRLDPAFPLPSRQPVGLVVGRRSFLGTLAALLAGGRWTRERRLPEVSLVTANGFLLPPSHPVCRCVSVTTWNYDHPHLEPGDVIQLTLPNEELALFTLTSVGDHGRRLTMREHT